jgi:hypothetical protein
MVEALVCSRDSYSRQPETVSKRGSTNSELSCNQVLEGMAIDPARIREMCHLSCHSRIMMGGIISKSAVLDGI